MQVLTQNLPSGIHYDFPAIQLKPLTYAQTLEYLSVLPKDPIEKLYLDYCTIKEDDPNINKVSIVDFEFLRFYKKAITISKDPEIRTTITCPRCGNKVTITINISQIRFESLEESAKEGLTLRFNDQLRKVRIPTMEQFLKVFSKYRMYKKVTDLRIIKLISLFEETEIYHQKIEHDVLNATYKDVTVLAMLEDIYFDIIKPHQVLCHKCLDDWSPSAEQVENLTPDQIQELRIKAGGISVGIDSLAEDFFRDILINNQLTDEEVIVG